MSQHYKYRAVVYQAHFSGRNHWGARIEKTPAIWLWPWLLGWWVCGHAGFHDTHLEAASAAARALEAYRMPESIIRGRESNP